MPGSAGVSDLSNVRANDNKEKMTTDDNQLIYEMTNTNSNDEQTEDVTIR